MKQFPGSSVGSQRRTVNSEVASSNLAQGDCGVHRHTHHMLNTVPRKYTTMRKTRTTKKSTKKNIQPLEGPVYVEAANSTHLNGGLAANFLFPEECVVTRVEVNGNGCIIGDATSDCYIGNGESAVPRGCGNVAMKGDTLRWNGYIAGFQLDSKDRIDIHTKAVNAKIDVTSVPVAGHGVTMSSGKAKIYSTPGLIGGSWAGEAGDFISRRNDERCVPIRVIISDFDPITGCIEVKTNWFQDEGQADLRDYVAMRNNKVTVHGISYALNLSPQEIPTDGKAGDFFVWGINNKLYYHDGNCWNRVITEPASFNLDRGIF